MAKTQQSLGGVLGGVVGGVAGFFVGGPAGAAYGAGMGYAAGAQIEGQQQANQQNAEQAQHNRNFQENMSNTAHQRAVSDMKKAGLNPILAAGSPASTPSGAQATMQNPYENLTGAVTSTAGELRNIQMQKGELQLQQGAIGKQQADTANTQADTIKKATETKLMKSEIPKSQMQEKFWRKVDAVADKITDSAGTNANDVRNEAYRKKANEYLLQNPQKVIYQRKGYKP